LKHVPPAIARLTAAVSIHQSIKSRVETALLMGEIERRLRSLSINPSNQGLKPDYLQDTAKREGGLYPSIHQIKG